MSKGRQWEELKRRAGRSQEQLSNSRKRAGDLLRYRGEPGQDKAQDKRRVVEVEKVQEASGNDLHVGMERERDVRWARSPCWHRMGRSLTSWLGLREPGSSQHPHQCPHAAIPAPSPSRHQPFGTRLLSDGVTGKDSSERSVVVPGRHDDPLRAHHAPGLLLPRPDDAASLGPPL
jgi:hypothetical protein